MSGGRHIYEVTFRTNTTSFPEKLTYEIYADDYPSAMNEAKSMQKLFFGGRGRIVGLRKVNDEKVERIRRGLYD